MNANTHRPRLVSVLPEVIYESPEVLRRHPRTATEEASLRLEGERSAGEDAAYFFFSLSLPSAHRRLTVLTVYVWDEPRAPPTSATRREACFPGLRTRVSEEGGARPVLLLLPWLMKGRRGKNKKRS